MDFASLGIVEDAVADQVGEHSPKQKTVHIDWPCGFGIFLDKIQVILPGKAVV